MRIVVILLAVLVSLVPAAKADMVRVEAMGQVAFNGITTPPLGSVTSGEMVNVSFMVDSGNFVEGIPGDTRGYVIDHGSFVMSFSSGVAVGLVDPFPPGETPFFTLVEGFPVSDGFFVSTSAVSPGGVPLAQTPYQFNLDLGYEGATLTSLDILDALGTYDFTGLTRYGFTIWRVVPDNVQMEIEYQQLTISGEPVPVVETSWGRVKALYE